MMKRSFRKSLRAQNWLCHYCHRQLSMAKGSGQRDPLSATKDHKHPAHERRRGASNEVVAACFSCNDAKANLPFDVFMAIMSLNRDNPAIGHHAARKEQSRRDKERDINAQRVTSAVDGWSHNPDGSGSTPGPAPSPFED
jgi:hypothetical protein